jgi:NAD-dependent dihydropyrimidine dehydrogenase PreA subunit
MSYVIAEPCINVKDASCAGVCPVDCIHPRKDEDGFPEAMQLYINPDDCIDCGACESVCPVTAIFPEEEVPEKWKNDNPEKGWLDYIRINREYYK